MTKLDLLVFSDNLFVLSYSQTYISSSLTTDSFKRIQIIVCL